ncbi:MAG: enoyl-[acyl-carrier-protein] reductase FabK [bacterium]
MLKTKLCDLLCIEYPIIQGGMAWVSDAALASAVSNAGGLGIIASGSMPPDMLREEIKKIKTLTNKPYGVNIILMRKDAEEILNVIVEEKVPVLTTGAGNPGKYLDWLKGAGIKVLPVISSVLLAKRVARQGVDGVIAEGTESGGHIGETTTLVLVPQVVDAVDVPVIAAGGIADGRGLTAALCLGACGVQIGTRFIATNECTVHDNFKQAILKANDRDTIATGRNTGHPVRVLKNKLTRIYEHLESQGATKEELEALGIGKLHAAARLGDVEEGSVMAGQISGMIKDILPVEEVIHKILREADEIINNLKGVTVD